MCCVAPCSTEWFDGVDLDGEAASGSAAASPLPAAGGGGAAAASGSSKDSTAWLDPRPDAAQSGSSGSGDASDDVPGIDLLVLRGGGAAGADPGPGRSPDRSGAGATAAGTAAPDATEAGNGRGEGEGEGEGGASPGMSAAAGSAEAGGGAHVRVAIAAGPGEQRVDVTTAPVAVHVYLEVRSASIIACPAAVALQVWVLARMSGKPPGICRMGVRFLSVQSDFLPGRRGSHLLCHLLCNTVLIREQPAERLAAVSKSVKQRWERTAVAPPHGCQHRAEPAATMQRAGLGARAAARASSRCRCARRVARRASAGPWGRRSQSLGGRAAAWRPQCGHAADHAVAGDWRADGHPRGPRPCRSATRPSCFLILAEMPSCTCGGSARDVYAMMYA